MREVREVKEAKEARHRESHGAVSDACGCAFLIGVVRRETTPFGGPLKKDTPTSDARRMRVGRADARMHGPLSGKPRMRASDLKIGCPWSSAVIALRSPSRQSRQSRGPRMVRHAVPNMIAQAKGGRAPTADTALDANEPVTQAASSVAAKKKRKEGWHRQ